MSGHLRDQMPVDDVLNDFESVNLIQSAKLRCMSRHENPLIVNLRDGHLNLVTTKLLLQA